MVEKAIKSLINDFKYLLPYLTTHSGATIEYVLSKIVLYIDTGALYLSLINAQNKISIYYYLSNPLECPWKISNKQLLINSPLLAKSKNIKNVVRLATKVEIVGVLKNINKVFLCTTYLLNSTMPNLLHY